MFFCHLCVFFGGLSVSIFCPFVDGIVCFLDIELQKVFISFGDESLVIPFFASIFYHSVGCLFTLFRVLFVMKKLLSVIKFHLFLRSLF